MNFFDPFFAFSGCCKEAWDRFSVINDGKISFDRFFAARNFIISVQSRFIYFSNIPQPKGHRLMKFYLMVCRNLNMTKWKVIVWKRWFIDKVLRNVAKCKRTKVWMENKKNMKILINEFQHEKDVFNFTYFFLFSICNYLHKF